MTPLPYPFCGKKPKEWALRELASAFGGTNDPDDPGRFFAALKVARALLAHE